MHIDMTACKKKSQDHRLVMRCAPVGGFNSVQLNSALVAGIEKFRHSSCEELFKMGLAGGETWELCLNGRHSQK